MSDNAITHSKHSHSQKIQSITTLISLQIPLTNVIALTYVGCLLQCFSPVINGIQLPQFRAVFVPLRATSFLVTTMMVKNLSRPSLA